MLILVITNEVLKQELLAQGPADELQFLFTEQVDDCATIPSPYACIDLLFDGSAERCVKLAATNASLIIVHAMNSIRHPAGMSFIRLNAWPGFLQREIAEITSRGNVPGSAAPALFALLGKRTEWVPDICGFISARVIACIINEAFFALEENISSAQEIDTAMKLGTNYPYGPFDWAEKIGLKEVYHLLQTLSVDEPRYLPCRLLKKKALA